MIDWSKKPRREIGWLERRRSKRRQGEVAICQKNKEGGPMIGQLVRRISKRSQ